MSHSVSTLLLQLWGWPASCRYYIWLTFRSSQWSYRLRRRSSVSRLLGMLYQIPPEAWLSVSCECCVLPDRGLCNGPITDPEKSYWVCRCVIVYVIKYDVVTITLHTNIIIYKSQQDTHVTELILSDKCSTCFGLHHHPSSGAQNNCNYIIW
jgi:hypothetical protein